MDLVLQEEWRAISVHFAKIEYKMWEKSLIKETGKPIIFDFIQLIFPYFDR